MSDPEGDRERDRFVALLKRADAEGRAIPFWWRDDDAIEPTPALDRLLQLSDGYAAPLALAVIPVPATEALAVRLAGTKMAVLQHGWQHTNHSPAGEKKTELGDHRPANIVVGELRAGFARLSELFPDRFLPVLVPPWNRISSSVLAQLPGAGYSGLSAFGRSQPSLLPTINTHVDILEWHPVRRPKPRAQLFAELCRELEWRLAGSPEPVGILSHHLVHEEASWTFLDELLALTKGHRWMHAAQLFQPASAGSALLRGAQASR